MIVEGHAKFKWRKKMIRFGAYALVHMGTDNTMGAWSAPAIVLQQFNNGDRQYFINIYTGKRIQGHVWAELPVTNLIIAQVERLAELEQQPIIEDGNLIFEWNVGEVIEN